MSRPTKITKYDEVNVDIDVEVEIDIDDVLEFIRNCGNDDEINRLSNSILKSANVSPIKVETLNDEFKYEVIKEAFNKYTLEELENKLK